MFHRDSDVPITYFIDSRMYLSDSLGVVAASGNDATATAIATADGVTDDDAALVDALRRAKNASAPIAMFVSNCDAHWVSSPRGTYLRELARHVNVHSYGSCMHNRDIPKELLSLPAWEVKWAISRHYKYATALPLVVVGGGVVVRRPELITHTRRVAQICHCV